MSAVDPVYPVPRPDVPSPEACTPTGAPWQTLESQLCFALHAASRAMVRSYTPLLAPVGLTYPQYLVLMALWQAGGPLSVGELGDRLHLDSGTLTPLVKRLEGLGHVTRRRDVADERRVLVELTPAGDELRVRLERVPLQIACRAGLPAPEIADLRARLVELTTQLEHVDVDQADRWAGELYEALSTSSAAPAAPPYGTFHEGAHT